MVKTNTIIIGGALLAGGLFLASKVSDIQLPGMGGGGILGDFTFDVTGVGSALGDAFSGAIGALPSLDLALPSFDFEIPDILGTVKDTITEPFTNIGETLNNTVSKITGGIDDSLTLLAAKTRLGATLAVPGLFVGGPAGAAVGAAGALSLFQAGEIFGKRISETGIAPPPFVFELGGLANELFGTGKRIGQPAIDAVKLVSEGITTPTEFGIASAQQRMISRGTQPTGVTFTGGGSLSKAFRARQRVVTGGQTEAKPSIISRPSVKMPGTGIGAGVFAGPSAITVPKITVPSIPTTIATPAASIGTFLGSLFGGLFG